ncbi:hypothetical protein MMC30_005330 [Trapelia coarctata]|nr:hypothetical protein [Trapelia coarctata]
MSKRKHGESRTEEPAGGVPKRAKTAHSESSGVQPNVNGQNMPEKNSDETISAERAAKQARKLAKRERRKAAKEELAKEHDLASVNGIATKRRKHDSDRRAKKEKKNKNSGGGSGWQVSDAVGGCLVDVDPVFSVDEQYLLLAYDSSIAIYATSTSLQVRTLYTNITHGNITAFALSACDPSQLYVSLNHGLIEKWDWVEGNRIGKWVTSSKITGLKVTTHSAGVVEEDFVCTVDSRGTESMITAHLLRAGFDEQNTETHTLFKSSDSITNLNVLSEGNVLVACVGRRLIIGQRTSTAKSPLKELIYTWREVEGPEWITSLNARFTNDIVAPVGSREGTTMSLTTGALDVATGGIEGAIFIYRNLLGELIQKERKKRSAAPVSQKLHWHRNGVGAIKWSADGNYLISGGIETVMVLWQLDTGAKQFLPHLSAPIESIVVSPSGSSYAIRIADNSAMVLSTAELQPTVSVSGIQLATSRQPIIKVPDLLRVSERPAVISTFRRPAATLAKASPGQLLLAVPGSSSSRIGITPNVNAAYLQTMDMRSGSQTSRQALTRTKVTDRNMGPEANIIDEPNVVLLQTSRDGKWLATVEEWTPPRQDVQFLAIGEDSNPEEQTSRIEVYLKFWLWNEESKNWELVSRIEAPHSNGDAGQAPIGRVLDLVEDPSATGFATIGDEGLAKVWRPQIRYRDGITVTGKDGQALTNWSCRQAITLAALNGLPCRQDNQITARLAFSADGSLLVVGHHSPYGSLLYTVDTEDGSIRATYPDIFVGALSGLGVIERYLVILADELVVWDIVDDRLNYIVSTASLSILDRTRIAATHLAVDQEAGGFAVAIPEQIHVASGEKVRCQLALFDPAQQSPLYTTTLPHALKALLPSIQRNTYIAVDAAAQVRTISQTASRTTQSLPVQQWKIQLPERANALADIYGGSFGKLLSKAKNGDAATKLLTDEPKENAERAIEEEDKVVVRQHELTELFDTGHSFALPSVTNLFEQVAGLLSRKIAA